MQSSPIGESGQMVNTYHELNCKVESFLMSRMELSNSTGDILGAEMMLEMSRNIFTILIISLFIFHAPISFMNVS